MKRAILLRHASAADAREDAARELTKQGREQACAAGSRIAALGALWQPSRALCSSALRASATLEAARASLCTLAEIDLDAGLYLASAGQLLAALQRVPDADACVLVVAHEPGISDLVRQLTSGGSAGRSEAHARKQLARGMTPGSFAALALRVSRWGEVRAGCGELAALER